jgi:hypothetical protein
LEDGGGRLVGQNFMVGQILDDFFEKESKTSTMDGKK